MEYSIDFLKEKAERCLRNKAYDSAILYYRKLYEKCGNKQNLAERIVKLYNSYAMLQVNKGLIENASALLGEAEEFAGKNLRLLIPTLNNMACLYRQVGRPKAALSCLERCLTIEYRTLSEIKTDQEFELKMLDDGPADTHLNLCAVLSSLGKHEIAYLHALKALTFMQAEMIERQFEGSRSSSLLPTKDRAGVLCIAYYNLGAELEFLGNLEESEKMYKKGAQFSRKFIGEKAPLEKKMLEAEEKVKGKIAQQNEKKQIRQAQSSYRLHRSKPRLVPPHFHKVGEPQKLSSARRPFFTRSQTRIIIRSNHPRCQQFQK